MNTIKITGKIISLRLVQKGNLNILNVNTIDDTYMGSVKFHSAFRNEEDIKRIQSLEEGDEITYTGTVFDLSTPYKVIEVFPNQILYLAKVKREYLTMNAIEDESLMQNERE